MTFHLYLRDFEGDLIRTPPSYSSFVSAARAGKSLTDWGQFHVECPDGYVPTREEQLLITPSLTTKKKQQLLDTL